MKGSPGDASKGPGHRGRVLAIDFGTRRLGLAVSDLLGITTQALSSLERVNRNEDFRRLRKVCREHEVKQIVVGYPLRLSGDEGEMARRAASFARRLHRELGLPVALEDERLTTFAAKEILSESGASRQRQGRAVDSVAASLVLRAYLDRQAKARE
ncbi:MAG TPA: Holliday junction resolvase RuvX [Candidatus Acidoferrales bacterium]